MAITHPYFGKADNEEDDTYIDFIEEDDFAIVANEEELGAFQ